MWFLDEFFFRLDSLMLLIQTMHGHVSPFFVYGYAMSMRMNEEKKGFTDFSHNLFNYFLSLLHEPIYSFFSPFIDTV